MASRDRTRALARLALAALAASACRAERLPPDATRDAAVDSTFHVDGRAVPPALVNAYVARHLGFTSRGGELRCAYLPLGRADDRIFVSTLCLELVHDGDSLATGSGRGGPVALRVVADGDSVRIAGHEAPEDGGGHAASIRRIFPAPVAERILAPADDGGVLERHLRSEGRARPGAPR